MNWSRDTWALIFASIIGSLFFLGGMLDVLHYFFVKILLLGSFSLMSSYIIYMIVKDFEQKNHSK